MNETKQKQTDQLAWLTAEAFASLAGIPVVNAQNYLEKHGTPLPEHKGWYEISTKPILSPTINKLPGKPRIVTINDRH